MMPTTYFKASSVVMYLAFSTSTISAQESPGQNPYEVAQKARFEQLHTRAKNADVNAMYRLGLSTFGGLLSDRESTEWLQKATQLGYGPALMYQVLHMPQVGIAPRPGQKMETPQLPTADERRAAVVRAYNALVADAEKGDLESILQLGAYVGIFEREHLCTKQQGFSWLRKAAAQNYQDASLNLGLMLLRQPSKSEKLEGLEFVKRAAEFGVVSDRELAIVQLVNYYQYGIPEIDLLPDLKTARAWATKGAQLTKTPFAEFCSENGIKFPSQN
jgi:TPR repeat protein